MPHGTQIATSRIWTIRRPAFYYSNNTEAYKTEGYGYARKATNKKNNVFKETLRNRWCTGVSIITLKPFILSNSRLWQPLTSQRPSNLRPTVRISSTRDLQCPAPGTSPAKPQPESSTDTIAQPFQLGSRASRRKLAINGYQPAHVRNNCGIYFISPTKESYPANILS